MAESRHPWDDAADSIIEWLENESEYYVEALKGGHAAPFSAPVNEAQKLDYYRRQVFATNPDGSVNPDQPNTEGREMLIKRLGIPGYTQVMAAVLGSRGSSPSDTESTEQADLPTVPEDY
jgi:hypothetical protein